MKLLRTLLLFTTVAGLSACGGNSNNDDSGGSNRAGIVAVGAPIVGASVQAMCSDGSSHSGTTNASGAYSVQLPQAGLPCALRATGGTVNGGANNQVLYSLATDSGTTVNITPLSTLVTAMAVNTAAGQSLATWYATPGNGSAVASGMAAAVSNLQTALTTAGYSVPAGFNPIGASFSAAAGDPYDDLLEALAQAIADDVNLASLDDLITRLLSGGSLPAASGIAPDPEAASGLELVAVYAGTYTVSGGGHTRGTVTISSDGATFDFDTGKTFTLDGANVYNRIPQFPNEPRVQIELPGSPQQRLRIYVQPGNTSVPVRFVYYPDVITEAGAIEAVVSNPSNGLTLTPTGDGAALAGGNGATGTFDGTARTFTTQVGFAIVNNMTLFDALGDSVLDKWEVKGFQPVVGTQSCGTGGNFPMVRLALGGVQHAANTTGGGCTIEIISVSNTEVVGRFAARLVHGLTGAVTTVTDGYFRYEVDDGDVPGGTGVPAGENGLAMTINGQSILWQIAPTAGLISGSHYSMSVTSANVYPAQAMYISLLPNQLGSHSCGSGPQYGKLSAYVRWDYVYYNANDTIGSCTINLTKADGTMIEGTFSGTFVSNTGVEKVVTDGHFRFTLAQ